MNLPPGCRFQTRCPYVMDVCRDVDPPLIAAADGQFAACHLLEQPVDAPARRLTGAEPAG
jgi:ABC-type dipeptide/oligopeptide/nickel transport system ATPase component